MATNWDDVNIKCPYYKACDERQISCESVTRNSSLITIRFHSREQKEEHMSQFCNSRFDSCCICALCERKYDQK